MLTMNFFSNCDFCDFKSSYLKHLNKAQRTFYKEVYFKAEGTLYTKERADHIATKDHHLDSIIHLKKLQNILENKASQFLKNKRKDPDIFAQEIINVVSSHLHLQKKTGAVDGSREEDKKEILLTQARDLARTLLDQSIEHSKKNILSKIIIFIGNFMHDMLNPKKVHESKRETVSFVAKLGRNIKNISKEKPSQEVSSQDTTSRDPHVKGERSHSTRLHRNSSTSQL
jgi:hypothetical protein